MDLLFLFLFVLAFFRVEAIFFLATFFIGIIIVMGMYMYCIGVGMVVLEKNNFKFVSYIVCGLSVVVFVFGVLFVISVVFGFDLIF